MLVSRLFESFLTLERLTHSWLLTIAEHSCGGPAIIDRRIAARPAQRRFSLPAHSFILILADNSRAEPHPYFATFLDAQYRPLSPLETTAIALSRRFRNKLLQMVRSDPLRSPSR